MNCPNCKSIWLVQDGPLKVESPQHWVQEFFCTHCHIVFKVSTAWLYKRDVVEPVWKSTIPKSIQDK